MPAPDYPGGEMPALVSILETALDAVPDKRFQSAEQFQNSLMQWLSGATVSGDLQAKHAGKVRSSTAGKERTGEGLLSPALMKLMEDRLASQVGPMAGNFVRRACRADADVVSISRELASHIPNPGERKEFVRAIENSDIASAARQKGRSDIQATQSGSAVDTPARGVQAPKLNAEQLRRVTSELAYFVGPLASRLVHSASASAPTLADLYRDLAAHIPSDQDRQEFLERVSTLLPSG